MAASENKPDTEQLQKELKKLQLQAKLQKNLSSELGRQKLVAIEATELASTKTKELEGMVKKLKLESQLRKNLSSELRTNEPLILILFIISPLADAISEIFLKFFICA